MTILQEGKIRISIPGNIPFKKFDNESEHGLTHCMKAVDFIVEMKNAFFFIEIKDPDAAPKGTGEAKLFIDNFKSGRLDQELYYKYRDTFLYRWASNEISKPIYYLVLIAIESITKQELIARTDELKRKLPIGGPPSGAWKKEIVHSCMVLNIEAWNHKLPAFIKGIKVVKIT